MRKFLLSEQLSGRGEFRRFPSPDIVYLSPFSIVTLSLSSVEPTDLHLDGVPPTGLLP